MRFAGTFVVGLLVLVSGLAGYLWFKVGKRESPRPSEAALDGGSPVAHIESSGYERYRERYRGKKGYEAEAESRPDSPGEMAAQRYQQRLSEDGTIPHDAMMTAFRQRQAMLEAQGATPADGGLSAAQWTWLGPGNIGGRVRAVYIDPRDPQRILTGSVSGGLWQSLDGGARFDPIDDFLPNLAITCIVADPLNLDTFYVGTGEGGFFNNPDGSSNTAVVRGAGVFKSTDNGATWERLESTSGPEWYQVCRLAVSPTDGQVLLAGTGTGLYRSTDGGQTWTRRTTTSTLDVDFHPTDGALAVAGRSDGIGQYSLDGGQTWINATGLTGMRIELAYAPSNPSVIYASVSMSSWVLRVYRSTDGGRTYSRRDNNGNFSTLANYDNAIWVNPVDENFIVVGGLELWRSTDGGVNYQRISEWSLAPQSPHADTHAIVHDPRFDGVNNLRVYIGNDGGIYRTNNIATVTSNRGWQVLNNNLGITQFYGAAAGPLSETIIGGTQDNGTLRFRGDPQEWDMIFGGDGTYAAADPTDGNVFYGASQRLNIFRTDNGGDSTRNISSGIGDRGSSRCNFIPYFMLDPNEPNRMLAAGRSLWLTNNAKASSPTWRAIKGPAEGCTLGAPDHGGGDDDDDHHHGDDADHTHGGEPDHFMDNNPCNISTMNVAPGNSDIIWVGHNRGDLYRTSNGTQDQPTWVRVDGNEPLLPKRWVSSIAISPFDASRVYVTFMGYEPDNVWRTTDAGATWTRITGSGSGTLPNAPVSWIVHHRTHPGWLYVATDVGIFASEDDGATWSTSNDGPANVTVDQLFWKDDCTLMAVAHGRGIYKADVCRICSAITKLEVRCDATTGKVRAALRSTLAEGTPVTFRLDDARDRVATTRASGRAKTIFRKVSDGAHTVCLRECANQCAACP